MKTIRHFSLLLVAFAILFSGCKSMNKTQKGAAIGVGGGAVIGGVDVVVGCPGPCVCVCV